VPVTPTGAAVAGDVGPLAFGDAGASHPAAAHTVAPTSATAVTLRTDMNVSSLELVLDAGCRELVHPPGSACKMAL
jgi:hypothetical protein